MIFYSIGGCGDSKILKSMNNGIQKVSLAEEIRHMGKTSGTFWDLTQANCDFTRADPNDPSGMAPSNCHIVHHSIHTIQHPASYYELGAIRLH
jgi:hypothetical protein